MLRQRKVKCNDSGLAKVDSNASTMPLDMGLPGAPDAPPRTSTRLKRPRSLS